MVSLKEEKSRFSYTVSLYLYTSQDYTLMTIFCKFYILTVEKFWMCNSLVKFQISLLS